MLSKVSNPPAGFDELTVEEKLNYVESLWDRIAATPETIPVPDWHLEVIEQRLGVRSQQLPPSPSASYCNRATLRTKRR